jgi:hypothetical protein
MLRRHATNGDASGEAQAFLRPAMRVAASFGVPSPTFRHPKRIRSALGTQGGRARGGRIQTEREGRPAGPPSLNRQGFPDYPIKEAFARRPLDVRDDEPEASADSRERRARTRAQRTRGRRQKLLPNQRCRGRTPGPAPICPQGGRKRGRNGQPRPKMASPFGDWFLWLGVPPTQVVNG